MFPIFPYVPVTYLFFFCAPHGQCDAGVTETEGIYTFSIAEDVDCTQIFADRDALVKAIRERTDRPRGRSGVR